MLLGVDTGGTFTDFVLFDGDGLRIHKVLSTPSAPEQAILQGVRDLGISLDGLHVIHGTTVATNAVLEGKGARTVFITNRGFADLLTLGRQARSGLYELCPQPQMPPVPRELCLETGGRLAADGSELVPLTGQDLDHLQAEVKRLQPQAIAITLLFSFLDDTAERAIAAAMPESLFVSRSSSVLPVVKEYERGITTWLNAYVGPLTRGYLQRLQQSLRPATLSVMQSHAHTCSAEQAAEHAVHLLLSGPAGGLKGAQWIAARSGIDRLMTLDMGGTSTDVALIDGDISLTGEARLGNYPVAVPMVDMHTIGAGGGSLAQVDEGGLLQVGPQSAGADPGPVCYRQGGSQATVTDANLILGHLPAAARLGGSLEPDREAALEVMQQLATELGLDSAAAAASGIVRLANEHMAAALRVISVNRGHDPREFTLACFGGAGGLHVCALAELLDMRQALVPAHAGVLSALGMLAATPGRAMSRSVQTLLEELEPAAVLEMLQELTASGCEELAAEGVPSDRVEVEWLLGLSYRGQAQCVELDWKGDESLESLAERYAHSYRQQYGQTLTLPVELARVQVRLNGPGYPISPHCDTMSERVILDYQPVHGCEQPVPVYASDHLPVDESLNGPAILLDTVATTWLAPGWSCLRDRVGNLLLQRRSDNQDEH